MKLQPLLIAFICYGLSVTLPAATATLSADSALTATTPYAGGPVTFTALVYGYTTASPKGWKVVLPEGWIYTSTSTDGPSVTPSVGSTGTLNWAYSTTPTAPASFTFVLTAPAGTTTVQTFTSTVYLKEGDVETTLVPSTVMLVPPGVPFVDTGTVTASHTTALAGGTIISERGAPVTTRGVVYATTASPTLDSGLSVTAGSGTGSFSVNLSNLAASTTYHLRSFATNVLGTSYGSDVSFATTAALAVPTITSPASTFDTTPTIDGTTETGCTITVKVDGATAGTATVNGNGIWHYSIASALSTGTHAITVTASDSAGSTSSFSYTLTIAAPSFAVPSPDGYAASTTGGGSSGSVTVSTATDFVTQATSSAANVITVVGTLDIGIVAVASNKTIQGADANATLDGRLSLTGVSNVIIRGLNLATATGSALTLNGASNVFITHCTFLDCENDQLALQGNTDNVTVSWCEFGATVPGHQASVRIGDGATISPLHVTFHHNWWSKYLAGALPHINSGSLHQYSDHLTCETAVGGTVAGDHAQLLSERNVYTGMSGPLTKTGPGAIRVIDNIYTSCRGTAPDAGTDAVFTPSYSYEMLATADVATTVDALAGNIAGATSTDEVTGTASITGPTAAVPTGTATMLTAVTAGFSATAYQWRLNNVAISGATGPTYTIASMSSVQAGTYTVAINLADGSLVVSTPLQVTVEGGPNPGIVSIAGPTSPVAPGASATLTAQTVGFTVTSYFWRLNDTVIPGATGPTYTITGMSSAQAGTYYVTISQPNGILVLSTPLEVRLGAGTGTARITGPTAPVAPGASATLTAVATGFTATAYQWRLDNAPIPGATSATYTIAGMSSAQAGSYTVAISQADGTQIVSTALAVSLGTSTTPGTGTTTGGSSNTGGSSSSGGGGGGAFGLWFLAAITLLSAGRQRIPLPR